MSTLKRIAIFGMTAALILSPVNCFTAGAESAGTEAGQNMADTEPSNGSVSPFVQMMRSVEEQLLQLQGKRIQI